MPLRLFMGYNQCLCDTWKTEKCSWQAWRLQAEANDEVERLLRSAPLLNDSAWSFLGVAGWPDVVWIFVEIHGLTKLSTLSGQLVCNVLCMVRSRCVSVNSLLQKLSFRTLVNGRNSCSCQVENWSGQVEFSFEILQDQGPCICG
jgi:hypothetical protein